MRTPKNFGWLAVSLLMLGAAAFVMSGCSSTTNSDSPATDGGGGGGGTSGVSVTVGQTTITTGATTLVEAVLVEEGSPVSAMEIHFTVEPASAGSFSRSYDTTSSDGTATTIFTASGAESVATIRATVSSTNQVATAGVQINEFSTGGDATINISLTPTMLLANGEDTATGTVSVYDAAGNPAPDSTLIILIAGERFNDLDTNGFFTPGYDDLDAEHIENGVWDPLGNIPTTIYVTGGNGTAQFTYVSGTYAATSYIRATVNRKGYLGWAEVPVLLRPSTEIASIYLWTDTTNLVVRATGGIETANLYARGYDVNGNPVQENIPITFSILDSPGGGEHLGDGATPTKTVSTNGQGVATMPISSGTVSGTMRIRATADTVISNATQLMVSAGPPHDITVGVDTCNIMALGIVNAENHIVAIVSDIYNNPVTDMTAVYFTCDEGVVKSHEDRTRDLEGRVETFWMSAPEDTDDGLVWVYAETAGGTVRDSTAFYNSWFPVTLNVLSAPASIEAASGAEAYLYLEALDVNGNPVINGTGVKAEGSFLDVENGSFSDGCSGATARLKITSTVLSRDYSMVGTTDDGIGAIDNVFCYTSSGASVTVPIPLATGQAYSKGSEIDGEVSLSYSQQTTYWVYIRDRAGNPLGNHALNVTATGGTVTGASPTTNSYGEATFSFTAPDSTWVANNSSKVTVKVVDTDPRGLITLSESVSITE